MDAADIILAIADGADGPYGLDPVRLMKGAFIADQRGEAEWDGLFDFEPYHYGPFDSGIYGIRDSLVRKDLLTVDAGGRYERYQLTDAGRGRVREAFADAPESLVWLQKVGRFVSSRPFADLLRQIYAAYPEYAQRSVFRT